MPSRTGDTLPEADEPGHQAGSEDQGADAVGHPGEQPLQRPEEPAGAGLRRRVGEPEQEAEYPTRDRGDLPPRASGLQRLVEAAAGTAHGQRHPEMRWISTSSSCWTA